MPELPEVETVKNGLAPHILGLEIKGLTVSSLKLRWSLSEDDRSHLIGQRIISLERRAKYLIFSCTHGDLIGHLGMSGSLSLLKKDSTQKHTHLSLLLSDGHRLVYCDPRRFGGWQWACHGFKHLPSFQRLGIEPLSSECNAIWMVRKIKASRKPIKLWLMDQANIVGVGNIYANEALFMAKIHPESPAASLTQKECQTLLRSIKRVLSKAIEQGGTTLRDFRASDGSLGYFQQSLLVYQQGGRLCTHCNSTIRSWRLGQRSTFACEACQELKSF